MNKLDRRFFDYGMTAWGFVNTPPDDAYANEQYIIGKNPSGAFANATPDSIAKFDGSSWTFFTPKHNDLMLLLNSDDFFIYNEDGDNSQWEVFKDRNIRSVQCCGFVETGETLPDTCHYDSERYETDYFLNTSTSKLYEAVEGNTWSEPQDIEEGRYYIDVEEQKAYVDRGDGLTETYYNIVALYEDALRNDRLCYLHENMLTQIFPFPSVTANVEHETITETHTVTADEISAKGFTLSNDVVSGKESNTLCFVQGLAQPVKTAFTVSGDNLSWSGKSLEGNVNAGDVFIVQYVKIAE